MNQAEKENFALYMTPEEYEECVEAVRYIEKERNIKFSDEEFKKMMLLLYDPALSVMLDD